MYRFYIPCMFVVMICFVTFVVMICFVTPVSAHNGAVAIAVPVSHIEIDGDLSDWPSSIKRYPIQWADYADAPKDTIDFKADFRVAYNEAKTELYLAVEVRDESIYVWDFSRDPYQDGCDFFIGLDHGDSGRFTLHYLVTGDVIQARLPEGRRAVEMQFKRSAVGHSYEWRIKLKEIDPAFEILHGKVLNWDVVINDMDDDNSFSWIAWGPGALKHSNVNRKGDLIFWEDAIPGLGVLKGQITRADNGRELKHVQVKIQSKVYETLQIVLSTNQRGEFWAALPEGNYIVEAMDRVSEIRVADGDTVAVDLRMSPAKGKKVLAKGSTQVAGIGTRQGLWQSYGVQDGLPSQTVFDIHQDRSGRLWIGTDRGVVQFDGERFTVFTKKDGLGDDIVVKIFEDRQGYLWFGTWGGGVTRFDPSHGSRQATLTTFSTAEGLAGDEVRCIIEDREGALWFGTEAGASRYDGRYFTNYTVEDGLGFPEVLSMLEDRRGFIWFGAGRLSLVGDGGHVTRYNPADQEFVQVRGILNEKVAAIFEDRNGYLWFGARHGAVCYDPSTDLIWENFRPILEGTRPDELPVADFIEDRLGFLWAAIGSPFTPEPTDGGAMSLDLAEPGMDHWSEKLQIAQGLAGSNVLSVFEDREGHLWFGTWRGGLSRYDGNIVTSFTTDNGLSDNRVHALLEDREGKIWFGTQNGVSRYDPQMPLKKAWSSLNVRDGLAFPGVDAIIEDQRGNIWFGTGIVGYEGGGASRYNPAQNSWTTFTSFDGLATDRVQSMAEDGDGRIWFASFGEGVSRYDPTNETWARFNASNGLAYSNVHTMLKSRNGDLWMGGGRGGVTVWKGEQFHAFAHQEDLIHHSIFDMIEDRRGRIWFGARGLEGVRGLGVICFDPMAKIEDAFTTFTTDDGLANDDVVALLEDSRGHIWLGTGSGISRFDGEVFQDLNVGDGLVHHNVLDMIEDRRGDIWIATHHGVTRYRPNRTPFDVHVSKIVADREYRSGEKLMLPSSQDYVAFDFFAERFVSRRNTIIYRYRLKQ